MIFCIYTHYTLDFSNYFSLKSLWQGRGLKKMGVLLQWILCVCGFYFNFFTSNTWIKVSNYELLFSFYFCKLLNLIFNIVIFMVVVGFQPLTGSWFSWNDIVRLYILNISLTSQHRSLPYLIFVVRIKSDIQHSVW